MIQPSLGHPIPKLHACSIFPTHTQTFVSACGDNVHGHLQTCFNAKGIAWCIARASASTVVANISGSTQLIKGITCYFIRATLLHVTCDFPRCSAPAVRHDPTPTPQLMREPPLPSTHLSPRHAIHRIPPPALMPPAYQLPIKSCTSPDHSVPPRTHHLPSCRF